MRDFVREHGITNYFEVGRMGIGARYFARKKALSVLGK